jgi:hypothetical protein
MAASIFVPGGNVWCAAGLSFLQTAFFMAQWEEKYTGILCTATLNNKVGVTETQYGLIVVALSAGVLGPNVTHKLMATPVFGEAFPVSVIIIISWCLFLTSVMWCNLYRVWTHGAAEQRDNGDGHWHAPAVMRDHAQFSKPRALLDLLPVVFLNIVSLFGWHSDIQVQMPRFLYFSSGMLFFYLTAQMIVFSMAQMPFRAIQPALVPFAALAFASKFAWLPFELALVKLTVIVCIVAQFSYVMFWLIEVTGEIKEELGINAFTVAKRDA